MVSIKLKFRPSTIEGKAGSLYYQVIYMRKVRQVATNFRIARSEWDSESEDFIIKDDDSSRANYLQYVQNHIEYDKKCFKRIVKKLIISDTPFTVDTVVDEFHNRASEITLFTYMEKIIGKLWRHGQHRTSETYQATLNSFRKFRDGIDVCFDDIDSEMLISYEYHLRAKELAPNTISFYMKRLRAVYNNAVEDGYVENKNLFKKVFTSSEKTIKRAIKFVREHTDLEPHPKKYNFYADPHPDPKLFYGRRYAFGLDIGYKGLTPSSICLDIKVLSSRSGYKVTRCLASGNYTDLRNTVEDPNLAQRIEDLIPSMIDHLESDD